MVFDLFFYCVTVKTIYIGNGRVAHKLTHLDLSGQPIRNLNCLPNQKSEAAGLEVLILMTVYILMKIVSASP